MPIPERTMATNLLVDEPVQDVEHKADEAGVHGQRLDDGPHQEGGQGGLLHQTLHDDGQHLLGVDAAFAEAQVGRCNTNPTAPGSPFSPSTFLAQSHKDFISKTQIMERIKI